MMFRNRSNALMSHWCLFRWTSLALWHSLVTFFVQYFTWTGLETDLWSLQMSLAQSIVIVVNCKLLLESRYWNLPLILSVIFSILCFLFLTVVTQVQINNLECLDKQSIFMQLLGVPSRQLFNRQHLLHDIRQSVWQPQVNMDKN